MADELAQNVGHGLVGRRQTHLRVDAKDDHIGFADGDLGLLANLAHEVGRCHGQHLLIFVAQRLQRLDSAGIDHSELDAVPITLGMDAVAGSAGPVIDHRQAFAHKTVEEIEVFNRSKKQVVPPELPSRIAPTEPQRKEKSFLGRIPVGYWLVAAFFALAIAEHIIEWLYHAWRASK